MITSLDLYCNLSDSNIGYVIGDHENVKPGDKIPLYIPKLMSSIEQGTEISSNITAIDSANYIFCNASECRPTIKTRIYMSNYIMVKATDIADCFDLKDRQRVSIFYANDSLRDIYFDTDIGSDQPGNTNGFPDDKESILNGGNAK